MRKFDLVKRVKQDGELEAVIAWFRYELREGDKNVPFCALRSALADEFSIGYSDGIITPISDSQREFEGRKS